MFILHERIYAHFNERPIAAANETKSAERGVTEQTFLSVFDKFVVLSHLFRWKYAVILGAPFKQILQ